MTYTNTVQDFEFSERLRVLCALAYDMVWRKIDRFSSSSSQWPLDEHPRLAAAKALGGRLPLLCVELHDGGGQDVADGRGSVMSSVG